MKKLRSIDEFVTADNETAGGVAVFKGTRVAVQTLFDHLEDSSLEEFLEGFPTVSREQAEAVIECAAAHLIPEIVA